MRWSWTKAEIATTIERVDNTSKVEEDGVEKGKGGLTDDEFKAIIKWLNNLPSSRGYTKER